MLFPEQPSLAELPSDYVLSEPALISARDVELMQTNGGLVVLQLDGRPYVRRRITRVHEPRSAQITLRDGTAHESAIAKRTR